MTCKICVPRISCLTSRAHVKSHAFREWRVKRIKRACSPSKQKKELIPSEIRNKEEEKNKKKKLKTQKKPGACCTSEECESRPCSLGFHRLVEPRSTLHIDRIYLTLYRKLTFCEKVSYTDGNLSSEIRGIFSRIWPRSSKRNLGPANCAGLESGAARTGCCGLIGWKEAGNRASLLR